MTKKRPSTATGKLNVKPSNMGFGGTRPRNCLITYDTYKLNVAEKAS